MYFEIEFDREDDGRWIAEAVELPGVLAYGLTQAEAREKVRGNRRGGHRDAGYEDFEKLRGLCQSRLDEKQPQVLRLHLPRNNAANFAQDDRLL